MTNLNAARLEARAHLPIVRKRIVTANKKTSQSSRSLFTTEELCELVAEMID